MERRLHDAAIQGNIPQLLSILEEDPLILHRCTFQNPSTKSPLHISAEYGHFEFSSEILKRNSKLADEVDLHKSTPLHLASASGHVEVVRALVLINLDTCFARDEDGRNPLHIAAIKGQVSVLDELLRVVPSAAREKTGHNEGILHLCVKYNKMDCLKILVNFVGDGELLNYKDSQGSTVLHLAVVHKRVDMIQFLVSKKWIDKNPTNNNLLTPMDLFIQSRRDTKDKAIYKALKRANLKRANHLNQLERWDKHMKWLEDHRSALMLVASLIAQMAFTAGLNPPGGLYQDGPNAGYAIAGEDSGRKSNYNIYLACCSVSLFASLSIILMLISGLPCRKFLVYISMLTMWIAIIPVPIVYARSIMLYTPRDDAVKSKLRLVLKGVTLVDSQTIADVISSVGVMVWIGLLLLLLIGQVIHYFVKLLIGIVRFVKWACNCCGLTRRGRPIA